VGWNPAHPAVELCRLFKIVQQDFRSKAMKANLILGIAAVAVGIVLLVMGLNATESFGEKVTEGITGRYSDKTTWFIIGGIAAIVIGAGVAFVGGRLKLKS